MRLVWVVISLIFLGIVGVQESFAEEKTWYLGEGIKKGDFFSYSVCHHSYKDCPSFEIHLLVLEVNDSFIDVNFTVIENGNSIDDIIIIDTETWKTSKYSESIKPYVEIFEEGITSWSNIASQENPKTFDEVWFKSSNIGGMDVKPGSLNSMEIDGMMFDTVNLRWSGSSDGHLLIADEFPFPINSELSVSVTTGNKIKIYTFELLTTITTDIEPFTENTSDLEAVIVNDPQLNDLTQHHFLGIVDYIQTYQNTKYGFAIDYPSVFFLNTDFPPNQKNDILDDLSIDFIVEFNPSPMAQIIIKNYPDQIISIDDEQYLKNLETRLVDFNNSHLAISDSNDINVISSQITQIDNHKAYQIVSESTVTLALPENPSVPKMMIITDIVNGDDILSISITNIELPLELITSKLPSPYPTFTNKALTNSLDSFRFTTDKLPNKYVNSDVGLEMTLLDSWSVRDYSSIAKISDIFKDTDPDIFHESLAHLVSSVKIFLHPGYNIPVSDSLDVDIGTKDDLFTTQTPSEFLASYQNIHHKFMGKKYGSISCDLSKPKPHTINGFESYQSVINCKESDKEETSKITSTLFLTPEHFVLLTYIDSQNQEKFQFYDDRDTIFQSLKINKAISIFEDSSLTNEQIMGSTALFSFVDSTKDPQYYVDRYNNESSYKEWFDSNYPDYSIEEAVGYEKIIEKVPSWIKNNAKWWVDGSIDDNTFKQGIQFMLQEKIVDVSVIIESKPILSFVDSTKDPQYYVDRYNNESSYKEWFDSNYPDYTISEAAGLVSNEIPSWVKNNAGWWAEGLLSEDDFLKSIEYLVEKQIIRIN